MTRDTKGFELLEQEILQAKAEALGRAGEKLRRALEGYRRGRAELAVGVIQNAELHELWQAVLRAREVLIILREGIGLRRHEAVDAEYDIPLANVSQNEGGFGSSEP